MELSSKWMDGWYVCVLGGGGGGGGGGRDVAMTKKCPGNKLLHYLRHSSILIDLIHTKTKNNST